MKFFSEIKRFVNCMSLYKKVFYSIFSITVLPVIIVFMLSANVVGHLIIKHISDTNKTFLKDYSMRLEEYVTGIERLSQEILYEDVFIKHLQGNADNDDICEILNVYMYREQSVESIIYVDTDGNYYYAEPNIMYRSSVYKSVLEQLGTNDGTPIWYTADSVYSNRMYMLRNVFTDDEKSAGSIIFMLNTDFFNDINDKLYMPYRHNIMIEGDSEILYTDAGNNSLMNGASKIKKSYIKNSYFSMDFPLKNWRVSTIISNFSMYKPMIVWYATMLLLTLVIVAALYLLSKRIVHFIISPMNKMIVTINNNKKGTKTYFDYNYDDEFGKMAAEFNEMIDELEKFRADQLEEMTLLKDVQIKALQAQITPHFLFNCLDIINWEAIKCGNTTISKTVVALSHILTVHMGKIDPVFKMSQELDYFEDYMDIVEKRFENTVHITLNCDPDAYNCVIVPLTLQTLAENSWIHGLSPYKALNIDIGIVRLDGELIINIFDDGKGMSCEKLADLRKKLSAGDSKERQSGIVNLNRRIKLLFGNEYGIEISSVENQYTAIEVTLPAKEE